MNLSLTITPSGHLHVREASESQPAVPDTAATGLRGAFQESSAAGLLLLATNELDQELPAEFIFWRGFAREFFQQLCHLDESAVDEWASLREPAHEELTQLVAEAPPMRGLEYL